MLEAVGNKKESKKLLAMLGLMLAPSVSFAGTDIAANFASLFDLTALVGSMVGVFVFANGLYMLYENSKGNHQSTIPGAIKSIVVGSLLVAVGWVYELMKGSIVGDNSKGVSIESSGQYSLALDKAALAAAAQVGQTGFGKFMPENTIKAVLAFVFFIGFVAFINGVYSLKDIGEANNRGDNSASKAFVRIIAGVLAMNITWFGCLIGDLANMPMLCLE